MVCFSGILITFMGRTVEQLFTLKRTGAYARNQLTYCMHKSGWAFSVRTLSDKILLLYLWGFKSCRLRRTQKWAFDVAYDWQAIFVWLPFSRKRLSKSAKMPIAYYCTVELLLTNYNGVFLNCYGDNASEIDCTSPFLNSSMMMRYVMTWPNTTRIMERLMVKKPRTGTPCTLSRTFLVTLTYIFY